MSQKPVHHPAQRGETLEPLCDECLEDWPCSFIRNSDEKQCDCPPGTPEYTSISGDWRCQKCFRRKDITKPQYLVEDYPDWKM